MEIHKMRKERIFEDKSQKEGRRETEKIPNVKVSLNTH